MRYTVPHYYGRFRCTADKCPNTCCAGWQIVIDSKSLRKYRKVKGGFRNRLLNAVDWKESTFHQCEGRCEFLNENNLCDLYTELGPRALCRTCRLYPRHIEEFENLREISLSLSCPEAAKLILGGRKPVRFLSKEKETQEETYEDFDCLLFGKLQESREAMIRLMQRREVPMRLRLAMTVAFGHDVQRRISQSRIFGIEALLHRYLEEDAPDKFAQLWEAGDEVYQVRRRFLEGLDRLEPLKREWQDYHRGAAKCLYGDGKREYIRRTEEFLEQFESRKISPKSSPGQPGAELSLGGQAELWTEQVMVYFLFTYYCGAIYDGDAFSKVKLAVYSMIVIWELVKYEWLQGKAVDFQLFLDTAVRFAREIEHSDLNLTALDQMFRTEKEYRGEEMLEAVMG